MRYLIIIIMLLFPRLSWSATGDTLFQCDFEATGTPSQIIAACDGAVESPTTMNANATIETSGAPSGSQYLKCSMVGGNSIATLFSFSHTSTSEITYVWREKWSTWPILGANAKTIRPFWGGGQNDYIGAIIGAYCPGCTTKDGNVYDRRFYISVWDDADIYYSSYAANQSSSGACTGSSNPYECSGGHANVNWSTDGWATWGYGADTWHEMRLYLKLPTTSGASDGKIYMWADDHQLFTIDNASSSVAGGQTLDYVTFSPSEAASEAYTHSYDAIIAYEGYIPPESASSVSRSLSGRGSSSSRGNVTATALGAASGTYRHANIVMH